jgi:hypothetical protein
LPKKSEQGLRILTLPSVCVTVRQLGSKYFTMSGIFALYMVTSYLKIIHLALHFLLVLRAFFFVKSSNPVFGNFVFLKFITLQEKRYKSNERIRCPSKWEWGPFLVLVLNISVSNNAPFVDIIYCILATEILETEQLVN